MISPAALENKIEVQERAVRGAAAFAGRLIRAKVADALAHAEKALTETLKAAPDGRASLVVIRRSRSYGAAIARLDEITDGLAGTSTKATQGFIRDFRERSFVSSFEAWAKVIPPEFHRDPPKPTAAERAAVRAIVLHGYDLRDELRLAVNAEAARLGAALAQAGTRGLGDATATAILKLWSTQAASRLTSTASLAINDSAVRADTAAGYYIIHPDYRDDGDPPLDLS